jgi:phosphoglycerol transferase MdoB-like AlkP superfamily enzyme
LARVLQGTGAYLKERWAIGLWALWIALFVEFLSRGSAVETLSWSFWHLPLLLLNGLVILGLLVLLLAPTGSPRVSFAVVAGIALTLAAVSGVKLRLKGLPLLPWDFGLAGEALDVVPWRDAVSLGLALAVPLFIGGSVLLLRKVARPPQAPPAWRERIGMAVAGVVLVALTMVDRPVSVLHLFRGQATPWDQAQNVRGNGFTLTMLRNLGEGSADTGKEYDRKAVAALAEAHQHLQDEPGPEHQPAGPVKPNVILILSESLFDPTALPGATFSSDPLPFFHQLQEKYTSGTMLSPEFAGSTANVELEVLTGLSMRFLPDGVLAYEKYVNRPVDSLASILGRQGYRSTAISPWTNNFFNSRSVYKNFGFGNFTSVEFMKPVYHSPYFADSEVARVIIDESEQAPGPYFIFANTAENHYPYDSAKFKENTIQVSGVSPEAKGILESYAQGCLFADQMLKTLVEHYSASQAPTMIIFFGDHLPLLGAQYSVYKETKYITGTSDPNFLEKIYRVPVLVWDNYRSAAKEKIDFGTTFLSPYILKQAGQPGTAFTDYLGQLVQQVPAVPHRRYWPSFGIDEANLKQYQELQQDILFGDQAIYGDAKAQIVKPDYVLGYGPITIEHVMVDETYSGAGDLPVTVAGRYFPPTAVVYVGEQRVESTWQSYDSLSVRVPPALLKGGAGEVQVRVLDVEGKAAIAESNRVHLTSPHN